MSKKPLLDLNRVVLIDFILFARAKVVSDTENTTSQRFLESMFHKMLSAQNAVNTSHIVFDSYIERSIKGPERDRSGGGAIHLAAKIGITPLPKQIKKF